MYFKDQLLVLSNFDSLGCRKCAQFHIKWFFSKTRRRNNAKLCGNVQGHLWLQLCYAVFKRILAWEGGISQTWLLDWNSSFPYHLSFDLAYIGVWMFRFYKTILNLKTRLQAQNLKKTLIFFSLSCKPVHLLQNWIENKIHFLQNAFVLQNEHFYWVIFFLTELNFWKRIQIFILNKYLYL